MCSDFNHPVFSRNTSAFEEGQSSIRPPLFRGDDYPYWKSRMIIYLKGLNWDMWLMVKNGYETPTLLVDNVVIPKPELDWNAYELKCATLNARTMNALCCALSKTEYNAISFCLTAQEIWHILELRHEGTQQVKESRLSLLKSELEQFEMASDECVKAMYSRLNSGVYKARALGEDIPELEVVRKILRVLPKSFESKVVAIRESKDLRSIKVDDLIGNLIAYEMEMSMMETHRDATPLKKTLALDSNEEMGEDMALLTSGFKRILKLRHDRARRDFKIKKLKEEEGSICSSDTGTTSITACSEEASMKSSKMAKSICYKCKKPGHMKSYCPLIANLKDKGKARRAKIVNCDTIQARAFGPTTISLDGPISSNRTRGKSLN